MVRCDKMVIDDDYSFLHCPDFQGMVGIEIKGKIVAEVPAIVLEIFIAERIRKRKIRRIDRMTTVEVMG